MKKIISAVLALMMLCTVLASCAGENSTITVISREESSGTRSAFVELLKITDDAGNDATYDRAEITEKTSVMLTSVAGNKNAIGYVSLSSLSSDVKAIKVDGAEASVDNIKSGKYPVARDFNLAYKAGTLTDIAQDFIDFVMSNQGQAIIEKEGCISVGNGSEYKASGKSGTVKLAGSTSVAPIIEVLADAYKKLNPQAEFEVQQTGSSAGMTSATEGVCDIGMASRELKDSEKQTLTSVTIAIDGIAVIVNNENKTDALTSEQITKIFKGEVTDWNKLG